MRRSHIFPIALTVILLLAAALRLYGLGHGLTFHPDERHIVGVTERLTLADPNPHFFAYGSFPFYLTWGVSELLGEFSDYWTRYDGLFYVGRALSVFFGVLGILLTYLLGTRLGDSSPQGTSNGRMLGLLAAVVLAFNVFHFQLSRFYTVDVVLTTFTVAVFLLLVRFVQEDRPRDLLWAGVVLGLAIATKIGAITLLLPFGLAFLLALSRHHGWLSGRRWLIGSVATLAVPLIFVLVEPFAIFDFDTFVANNNEQIRMVMGEWRPPYTIQYAGTTPYLYHLEQMGRWLMGWPVLVMSGLGVLGAILGLGTRFRADIFIVVVWGVFFFFSTAGQQVKFPRYLLPLYPLLAIACAGALLWWWRTARIRFGGPLVRVVVGACPTVFVVGWAVVSSLAFSTIYGREHSYTAASRWIFDHVARGSLILGVHWDDRLPLWLPGFSPHDYGYRYEGDLNELPLYEPDDARKLALVSERLSRADYLIFPTPRIPGSIPRIAHERPQATALLQLLYAEQLGYKLVQTVKYQPTLGPFELNTDLADESFSVYDHPKVAIFQNIARLPAGEIQSRILSPERYAPLPTREQILLARAGEPLMAPGHAGLAEQMFSIVTWYAVISLLGMFGALLLWRIAGLHLPAGYALTKIGGLITVTWCVWILRSLGLIAGETTGSVLLVATILIFASVRYGPAAWRELLADASARREVVRIELAALISFVCWLVIQAFHPEIFWGEKPMDFTFLNYFIRADSLPPQDPWAAGSPMYYYYFGSFAVALVHRLSGVDSAIGYNLGIATVGMLIFISILGLFRVLGVTWRSALGGALIIGACSNLEWIRLWLIEGKSLNFDLFWATTRLYTSPQITEYPQWSVLFADLHAHLIALPIATLFLALATVLLRVPVSRALPAIALRLGVALSLGTLLATNTWDFITGTLVLGLMLAVGTILAGDRAPLAAARSFGKAIVEGLLIIATAIFLYLPFFLHSIAPSHAGWGWVTHEELNSLSMVLRHLGQFAIPLLVSGLLLKGVGWRAVGWRWGVIIGCGSVPLVLALVSPALDLAQIPWGIVLFSAAAIVGGLIQATSVESKNAASVGAFIAAAGLLVVAAELLFLLDRMNTTFKSYNMTWLLFGTGSIWMVSSLYHRYLPRLRTGAFSTWDRIVAGAIVALPSGVILCSLIGGVLNIWVMTTFQRVNGPRPTFDGLAYLGRADHDTADLISWIRTNVRGTPVVVEAHGPSYREFTRISMFTGLPTIIGWDHHVRQRGLRGEELQRRQQDVRAIYNSPDPVAILSLLGRYGAELIVVGEIEKRAYDPRGLKKFAERPDLFRLLYRSGSEALYAPLSSPLAGAGLSAPR